MTRAIKVEGMSEIFWGKPSISLNACYDASPTYFLNGFKEVSSTILAKVEGVCASSHGDATGYKVINYLQGRLGKYLNIYLMKLSTPISD